MRRTTVIGSLDLIVADGFWRRLKGLLGRHHLAFDEGMLITPCASIHTFGMRMPISVICLGRDGVVLKVVHRLLPNRVLIAPSGTYEIIELASDVLRAHPNLVGRSFWS